MRSAFAAGIFCVVALCGSTASAGIYTDDLSRCLVRSSSEQDRTLLTRWMFISMASNPAVKSLATVTPQVRTEANQGIARLFERLILTDCRKETIEALKYDGRGAFEAGFQTLGMVAGRELMMGPGMADETREMETLLHKDQWEALAKEAGVSAPTVTSQP
jgi:hypothetical protein